MRKILLILLTLFLGITPMGAQAQECAPGSKCVSADDLNTLLTIAREKQCLLSTQPTITMDPVTLTIDRQGRIFFTGSAPHPYSLKMSWCNYTLAAQGKVTVVAAVEEPPDWGFRFRPKAYMGVLPLEPFHTGNNARSAVDAGLMLDPLYYKFLNLNVHVGFRAVGAGIGVDLTRNFGVYAGYALTWDGFRQNPEAALWFSFF